ncbi:MAG: tetratricopeptide repeat protein [Tissierellales bacterium]|nr:tetratricopeptide repeat protein [Tissierellales bacterium]
MKDRLAEQENKTFDIGQLNNGGITLYSRETSLSKHFNSAINYYLNDDLSSAIEILFAILEEDPNHVDSLNLLGIIYNQTGDSQTALDYLNKAYSLSKNPDILQNINIIKEYPGQKFEAIVKE